MKKLIDLYNAVEEKLLVYSLAFTTLLLFLQVIMRFVFNNSLSWSEELARYIFIWEIWLGSSITFRENKHIKVEILYAIVKTEKAKAIVDILADVILFIFCTVLLVEGADLVLSMHNRGTMSPAMRIPLWIVYLSLPVGLLAVCCRIVGQIKTLLKAVCIHKKEGRE